MKLAPPLLASTRAAALFLASVAALSACTVSHDGGPDNKPVEAPATAEASNPMASFARMVPGEWRVTATRGTSTFDTWHWGPGERSMRVMTDGLDSQVIPEPWRELQVYYWHPGRKQVCTLGLSPYASGVSEGTIEFDGETATGVFDLHQTSGLRKLGLRWTFEGPDHYRDVLLEATGPEGLQPMNEWDQFRSKGPPAPRMQFAEEPPGPSKDLKVFESLLGRTWEAKGEWTTGERFHIETTFEWIPYAEGIYARTVAVSKHGEPVHLLDAYFFRHTGAGVLRCLALSKSGGVYEGDVSALDGGALQLDLECYEEDRVGRRVVRLDFEQDGTLRDRMWSAEGTDRELLLDVIFAGSDRPRD
ncbi:MAG: hypothetical protein IT453_00670 [Planctomycetes bacterium]|nr:hypothetical protein [Planctomycetota bacterium]